MGAKLSKKKKGYCLGAGKDGESTETTEVEQKEAENQSGQIEAADCSEETNHPSKTEANGTSEDQKPQAEKQTDTEIKLDEPTKDDPKPDQMPEKRETANITEKVETLQGKPESECSIQEESCKEVKAIKTQPTETPPSQESKIKDKEEQSKNLESSSPCASVTEPDVKEGKETENQVVIQQNASLHETVVKETAKEQSNASKPFAEEESQIIIKHENPTQKQQSELEQVPEEVIKVEENKDKVTTPVKTPETLTKQVVQDTVETINIVEKPVKSLEDQLLQSVKESPIPLQTCPPILETTKSAKVSELAVPEGSSKQLVPSEEPSATEKRELVLDPQAAVSKTADVAHGKEPETEQLVPEAESLASDHIAKNEPVAIQQSESNTDCPCGNEVKQDEKLPPNANEVSEQPAYVKENPTCQDTQEIHSQSSEAISTDQPHSLTSPSLENWQEVLMAPNISAELEPLQNVKGHAAELSSSVEVSQPAHLEDQTASNKENHSPGKLSVGQEHLEKDNKAALEGVHETLNQDGKHVASVSVAELDKSPIPDESLTQSISENKMENPLELGDGKISLDDQIKDKPVTLNGLPSKEGKEKLENGSDHVINDFNGQNENHEIEVCNDN